MVELELKKMAIHDDLFTGKVESFKISLISSSICSYLGFLLIVMEKLT